MQIDINITIKPEEPQDLAVLKAIDWHAGCPVCTSPQWSVTDVLDHEIFSCDECGYSE